MLTDSLALKQVEKTGMNFYNESEELESDQFDSWCAPDILFDCKFVCNSAQIAALSEWAAVIFSPRFTPYYSLVTVETDPESQSAEETTSAVKINELWPTVWQERDGWCKEKDWRGKKREGGEEGSGINTGEFSRLKRENEYFQDFLQDILDWFHALPHPSFHFSVLSRFPFKLD